VAQVVSNVLSAAIIAIIVEAAVIFGLVMLFRVLFR
jgi:F0F1-type ATP synthase membrane subunit c/vacuolar-type H+-ATPase subunit K